MSASSVIQADIRLIAGEMQAELMDFQGSTWVISGGAGFLGAYFLDLLNYCNKHCFDIPCKVLVLENYSFGSPQRTKHLEKDRHIRIVRADVTKPFMVKGNVDYIVHAAGLASPSLHYQHPLEIIEVNVLGLRNMLELAREKRPRSVLSFSSSSIYGDPPPQHIPTPENYNGNVSCTGPQACHAESKRLGETLAVNYYRQFDVPVKIVRPFDIYGPGLRGDHHVLPNLFSNALREQEVIDPSGGTPTRSFCYVRDALIGFLKVLLSDYNGEAFNIGNDSEEVSMSELAMLVADLVGDVRVTFLSKDDEQYLEDSPQRQCPDLTKARTWLKFLPQVNLREGLERTLEWYREAYGMMGN